MGEYGGKLNERVVVVWRRRINVRIEKWGGDFRWFW